MSPKTSFITDDVLCHATRSAAAMFGSCTNVWSVTWRVQHLCHAPHLAPIFAGQSAGRIAALLVRARVLSPRLAVTLRCR